jgi:CPA1 family monovalent cation:H+ antiporter
MEDAVDMGASPHELWAMLLIAAVVAMLCRKVRIPYSVGLVATGLVLAVLPLHFTFLLTKSFIFHVLLPPLVFEAAFLIDWRPLRRDLPVVLVLATMGVVVAAAVTAAGMHWLTGWSWSNSTLFGVLIAATDPVSVIATFKEAGVHGRLRLLVEAESLFNDGVAALLFGIALAVADGHALTLTGMFTDLAVIVGGGIAVGAAVAGAVLLIAGRTDDHLVEVTFSTVAAYGSFLVAEHFHLSGVLATLTAGLIVGNIGSLGAISDRGRTAVTDFWEYAAFVANSLVFIMIGIDEARTHFAGALWPAFVAVLLVTGSRALTVYPLCAVFTKSQLRVATAHQHVLFWGGLRGALALALALGLPDSLAHRDAIVTTAFAVVAFSIFVQGLTMTPLLRRLGQMPKSGTAKLESP